MKEIIRELRKKIGITQEALAEKLDVSPQAVSKWETGLAMPDILTLPNLADIFGVSIDYLFGRYEKDSAESQKSGVFEKGEKFQAASLREAVLKHPDDYDLQYELIRKSSDYQEIERLADDIIQNCDDKELVDKVNIEIIKLRSLERLQTEKADVTKISLSDDELNALKLIYDENQVPYTIYSIVKSLDLIFIDITNLIISYRLKNNFTYSKKEIFEIAEKTKALYSLFYEKEEPCKASLHLATIYRILASIYAEECDCANTIRAVDECIAQLRKYGDTPKNEERSLIRQVNLSLTIDYGTENHLESAKTLKSVLENSRYDFIRDDERFIAQKKAVDCLVLNIQNFFNLTSKS